MTREAYHEIANQLAAICGMARILKREIAPALRDEVQMIDDIAMAIGATLRQARADDHPVRGWEDLLSQALQALLLNVNPTETDTLEKPERAVVDRCWRVLRHVKDDDPDLNETPS